MNKLIFFMICILSTGLTSCNKLSEISKFNFDSGGQEYSLLCTVKYGPVLEYGSSRFGGVPDISPGFTWPKWKNKSLGFLAQINLSEVSPLLNNNDLPVNGILYFFYDRNQESWGFDPKDRGSWKVIYSSKISGLHKAKLPRDIPPGDVFKEGRILFKKTLSKPDSSSEEMTHKLYGHPDVIQNAMELECQLASHGIYTGDSSMNNSPEAIKLKDGAGNWKLLFQVDSDENLGMMWGDSGRLYFWYDSSEKPVNYDNIWMILQCY